MEAFSIKQKYKHAGSLVKFNLHGYPCCTPVNRLTFINQIITIDLATVAPTMIGYEYIYIYGTEAIR